MRTTKQNSERILISNKIKVLREDRRWTQAELSGRLGLSQSRLSEIERGRGSFTAEQFLLILRLFNVSVTHFASVRKPTAELQNALARLGASHLQESEGALPSELLDQVGNVIWEALVTADSPRHVTSLAPVIVRNIDRVGLEKLRIRFREAGVERRLGWLVENILEAVRRELSFALPRKWAQLYRRADVVLGTLSSSLALPEGAEPPDLLDADILSNKTLEEVNASRSDISRRWSIATALLPDDFVEALRSSRAAR